MIRSTLIFVIAAIAEIAGCFCFFLWLRMGKSALWLIVGMASLAMFGWLLARIDIESAGRTYAVYGGIYIAVSLLWMWTIEGQKPDRFDLAGGMICLVGAAVIFLTPRG